MLMVHQIYLTSLALLTALPGTTYAIEFTGNFLRQCLILILGSKK